MKFCAKTSLIAALAGWGMAGALSAAEFTTEQLDFFEQKVRPVLVESCFECHSAGAKKVKGELYLDSRASILKGGDAGPVVVVGAPEKSLLIKAVEYSDPELQMPPKTRLAPAQVEALKQWVKLGLPWPEENAPKSADKAEVFDLEKRRREHWAWQPIRKPALPKVASATQAEAPIDRFIFAKLETEGLKPARAADKRTLVRRLYFDLLGLPPSPEAVEAFVNDPSPKATERLVDELLASPHFGERWARHWLDMMRYAETMGHEFDYPIHNAWRYRDYVIRAFNADVPYDQFVKEHLAGDLLKQPRLNPADGFNESVVGTASFWLPQQKHSPVDVRLEQAELIDNQIDVITKTFLGMTVSCARCHDHKFDAISTKDYYSLYGIIGSSRYRLADLESQELVLEQAKQLREIKQQIKQRLRSTTVPADWRVKDYLLAAREVLRGDVPGATDKSGDIILADFERDGFGDWKVTGTAFGEGPVAQAEIGSYQGDVAAVGKGFVNSHNVRRDGMVVQGDGFTGTLESPEFMVRRKYVHFLVGGGAHQDKTCVNLVVDGKVVRSVTGKNNNRMSPVRFEVNEFSGRKAKIEVMDQVTGSWGNIGLDHVVMSDQAEFFGADNQPLLKIDLVKAVAEARRLDAGTLNRWLTVMTTAKAATPVRLPTILEGAADLVRAAEWSDINLRNDQAVWTHRLGGRVLFGQEDELPEGWSGNGAAFAAKPTAGDDFRVGTAENPVKYVERINPLASGRVSLRLEGTWQSPSFLIENDFVHFLAAGQGSRVSLVVDGFTLIRNPIYGNLRQTLNSETPRWHKMDVRMWKGHRAYLEFVDRTPADPAAAGGSGADWFAAERVVLSDAAESPQLENMLTGQRRRKEVKDEDHAAAILSDRISSVVVQWLEGKGVNAAEEQLINWLLSQQLIRLGRPDDGQLKSLVGAFLKQESEIREPVTIPALADGTPHDEKVFLRGSPRRLGDLVPRRNLEALGGGESAIYEEGSGRLQLAEDWTSAGNPLLGRVMVNKVWHHLMGRGLVSTVDNFGVLGEVPSHPELLDWLAADFREQGWSVKKLIRQIVLSRTYQMASQPDDAAAETKDPGNIWWHRMHVKRLEGEAIRDAVLAVSGRLDKTLFGPSVPIHLTEFMDGRGRPGRSGPLDGAGRRSIYVEVRRNFLSPMMQAFDAPAAATTVGRRTVSNVPAQALIMMNDPFVVEQAKVWAQRVLKQEGGISQRVQTAYQSAFGRKATEAEQRSAVEFLQRQAGEYGLTGDAWQTEGKVWADFCHVLFNVKEFLFVN